MIFHDQRKTGRLDLEAIEVAMRSAVHQAGAAALTQLLQFEAPATEQRSLPCSCGGQARYLELRAKHLLSVLGEVELSRPYYLCDSCRKGQFPVDQALDVEHTKHTPGVRRMLALVGYQAAFQRGKEQ